MAQYVGLIIDTTEQKDPVASRGCVCDTHDEALESAKQAWVGMWVGEDDSLAEETWEEVLSGQSDYVVQVIDL